MNDAPIEINIDPALIIFTFDFIETKVTNLGLIFDYKQMSTSTKKVYCLLAEHVKNAEKKFRLKNDLKLAFNSFQNNFRIIVYLHLTDSKNNATNLSADLKQYFAESMQKLKDVLEAIKSISLKGIRPKLEFSAEIDELSISENGTIRVSEKDRDIVSLADKLSSQSTNSTLQSISIKVADKEVTLPSSGTKVIKEKHTDKSKSLTLQVIVDSVRNSASEFQFIIINQSSSNLGKFKGDEIRRKLLKSQLENTSLICKFYAKMLNGLTTEKIIEYELISIDENTTKLF